MIDENLENLYAKATKLAMGKKQTVGEKRDYYINLAQLEDLIKLESLDSHTRKNIGINVQQKIYEILEPLQCLTCQQDDEFNCESCYWSNVYFEMVKLCERLMSGGRLKKAK